MEISIAKNVFNPVGIRQDSPAGFFVCYFPFVVMAAFTAALTLGFYSRSNTAVQKFPHGLDVLAYADLLPWG